MRAPERATPPQPAATRGAAAGRAARRHSARSRASAWPPVAPAASPATAATATAGARWRRLPRLWPPHPPPPPRPPHRRAPQDDRTEQQTQGTTREARFEPLAAAVPLLPPRRRAGTSKPAQRRAKVNEQEKKNTTLGEENTDWRGGCSPFGFRWIPPQPPPAAETVPPCPEGCWPAAPSWRRLRGPARASGSQHQRARPVAPASDTRPGTHGHGGGAVHSDMGVLTSCAVRAPTSTAAAGKHVATRALMNSTASRSTAGYAGPGPAAAAAPVVCSGPAAGAHSVAARASSSTASRAQATKVLCARRIS